MPNKVALSIAGSDPSGGAGIQADLKVFSLHKVYGTAVPAALTAQNTEGVTSVSAVSPAFLAKQLETLLADIRPDAVKTGMLLTEGAVRAVADAVGRHRLNNLVIDPVMVSTSGRRLMNPSALDAMLVYLFPLAVLVTPNLAEAGVLAGMEIKNVEDVEQAARTIRAMGPKCVLVKGGHLEGDAVDVMFDGRKFYHYKARRVTGKELHGTGCVFSAAITANLAKGMPLTLAVSDAKRFVTGLIKKAVPVGKGRIPLV